MTLNDSIMVIMSGLSADSFEVQGWPVCLGENYHQYKITDVGKTAPCYEAQMLVHSLPLKTYHKTSKNDLDSTMTANMWMINLFISLYLKPAWGGWILCGWSLSLRQFVIFWWHNFVFCFFFVASATVAVILMLFFCQRSEPWKCLHSMNRDIKFINNIF